MKELLENYIRIEPGFQKSVNLAYDLLDEAKVSDFIPSTSSIEIIENLILSTYPSSTQRAHILVGPYGKGKSHVVLVLLALLKEKNKEQFNKILEALKNYNIELYKYVESYISSEKKLLPVIVQGSHNSITQAFLNAIQIALRDAEFNNLMPDTHFESAIKHINNWIEKYPDTASKFSELISPETTDKFILRLKQFDNDAYETFVKLYPQLSSGGTFNPFGGIDVVELYEKVSSSLSKYGYDGIFLVYDEFSKYLEANIKDTSVSDIKMLQDFAEKCNRSGRKQLHLLLIAHKAIENYIDLLPKSKVDGWRGVSERFTHIEMQSNYGQIYEVMGQAIKKLPDFYTKFCPKHKEFFEHLEKLSKKWNLFEELPEEQINSVITNCYPFHPITAYILPRLSELVAQNERTLFTFISDSGKNTLSYLLSRQQDNKSENYIITSDALYDYFEPLLKKEVYTSDVYKLYSLVNSILVRVKDNELQTKIIKTLAVIYLINRFEKIEPLRETLNEIYSSEYQSREIVQAIEDLENKKYVIYARKSNGYLRLKSPSTSDLKLSIDKEIAAVKNRYSLSNILQEYASDIYLYPTEYNEENSIIRYFDFKFITAEEVREIDNWELKLSFSKADGVVYAVIASSGEELKHISNYLLEKSKDVSRVFFIILKRQEKIENIATEYQAVINLISENQDDEAFVSELEIMKDDLDEVLSNYISSYLRPELGKAIYISNGTKYIITRKSQLANKLSEICEGIFSRTPIINNETINKNNLPKTTINSRNRVVKGLLVSHLDPLLGLKASSQDGSIARSLLSETGIIENLLGNPSFADENKIDEKILYVISIIREFFHECNNEQKCFYELYDKLTNPKYGIGLKRGCIPVFIAVVMHKNLGNFTLYADGKETALSEETLSSINDIPEKYSVRIENWSDEKIFYISELTKLFKDFINEKEAHGYISTAKAMQRWLLSLPKYSRECIEKYEGNGKSVKFDKHTVQFIKELKKFSLNPHDFIFIDIKKIFETIDFGNELVEKIKEVKEKYDDNLKCLEQGLLIDLKNIFNPKAKSQASLSSTVKDWYSNLNNTVKTKVLDGYKQILLDLCENMENNDIEFVEISAKAVSGLRIEDWSDQTIKKYLEDIKDFKQSLDVLNRNNKESLITSNSYSLITIDKDGRKKTKSFDKVEYTNMAKLLKNEIFASLDEMGDAISAAEKRQVLIEALESII